MNVLAGYGYYFRQLLPQIIEKLDQYILTPIILVWTRIFARSVSEVRIERVRVDGRQAVRFIDQQGRVRREEIVSSAEQEAKVYYYEGEQSAPYYTFTMASSLNNRFDLRTEELVEALIHYRTGIIAKRSYLRDEGISVKSLLNKISQLIRDGHYRTAEFIVTNLSDVVQGYRQAQRGRLFDENVPAPSRFVGTFMDFIDHIVDKGVVRGDLERINPA